MGKEALLKDFTAEGAKFFASVGTPAALVTGSSLATLFALSEATTTTDHCGKLKKRLVRLYHVFVLTSFVLAMNTVIISSVATVSMLHGRFDPKAETAYMMLRREFDYEFVLTRWSFIVALLCFLLGVTTRVILEYGLIAREKRMEAIAVVLLLSALIAQMLSYVNQTLYCWPNLLQMTFYVIEVSAYQQQLSFITRQGI